MSFSTNKSMIEDTPQTAGYGQLSRSGEGASTINLRVVRSLRLRPALAAGVAVVVLLLLLGYTLFLKSQYIAGSQVYVMPTSIKLLGGGVAGSRDEGQYEMFLAEQMLLVTRPDVLKATLDSLPHTSWAEFGGTEQDVVDNLTTLLQVQRVGTSHQVSISLRGSDPAKTAAVVNAITTAYLDAAHMETAADSDQRGQLLAEEKERIEGQIQADRTEKIALGASMGGAHPSVKVGNPDDSELSGIRTQLSEARAAHEVAAAQLAALSGVGPAGSSGLTAAADEQILGDAGLASMKASISQKKAQLAAQMAGMTSANPIYKQDQDEIADRDRTLDKMTADLRDKTARQLQDKLRADLQRTGDVESRLNGQLARQIASSTSAVPRSRRATEIEADIQRLGTQLASVDDALRSLSMEVSGPAQVRLSQPAIPPERPEANRKKQLLLVALPLAILCGIAAVVLARMRDKRIFIGVDVGDVLGFPPLVVLPARADVSQRVFEEYVLRLAAGIESAYRTGGARTFLLTAVSLTTDIGPLATALSRKFEEIGVNVIVTTASDMLSPTEGVPSAGSERMTPDKLPRRVELGTEGFVAANIARMKAEYGLVLLESDALLNCAETEYVARSADATILIVESGVTTRQELIRAAELLHRLNVSGMGAVLEEIQLRYADVDFRKAIEALEQRMSEPHRKVRGPRAQATPTEVMSSEVVLGSVIGPSTPEASVGAPQTKPNSIAEEFSDEVAAVNAQDAETAEDRVAAEHEPSHSQEVIQQVRAAPLADHDLDWQLPVFGEISAVRQAAPIAKQQMAIATVQNIEVDRTLPDVRAAMHDSVQAESQNGPVVIEPTYSGTTVGAADSLLHEKISPMPSARWDQPTSDGDSGLTREPSWIGRLLGRDTAPIVGKIPDAEDDAPDDVAPVEISSSARLPSDSEVTWAQPSSEDDYNVSLLNRLDQVSEIRPATATHTPATDISAFKRLHHLEMVPTEPIAVAAVPLVSEGVASSPEPAVPIVEVESPVRKGPAGWARADGAIPESAPVPEPVASAAVEPVPPTAPTPAVRGQRRPLTFRELMQLTGRATNAPVATQATDVHAAEPVGEKRQIQSADEIAQHRPVHAVPLEILGHLSGFDSVVPAVEAASVGAEVRSYVEPVVRGAEPAIEVMESAPAPLTEPVRKVAAISDAARIWEQLPEPTTSEVPKFHFSKRYIEEPKRQRDDVPPYEPYRPNPNELDDIEPIYHEASRTLNTGPWDPIPPLRPSMDNWRDRHSPVPANANRSNHQTNGAVKDGFNAYQPQRWIPEEAVPVEPKPESPSDRTLSRQWGLLSKFQQSRLTSASHPAARVETASDNDSGRDAEWPGGPYGGRRS